MEFDYIDVDEWAVASRHADDAGNDEHVICRAGSHSLMQSSATTDAPPGQSVAECRAVLEAQMRSVISHRKPGAWLFRHAPGVGKTTTFARLANEYMETGHAFIFCAPNVDEARAMADAAGTWVLERQNPDNCRQMADEAAAAAGAHRPLARHHAGRHRSSDFCRACMHRAECQTTRGQYRETQARFRRQVADGTVYAATTVHMLRYIAAGICASKHHIHVWIDEDLLPHIIPEQPEIPLADIMEWIGHAESISCSAHADDIAFMRQLATELARPLPATVGDCPEDHSTGASSRAIAIQRSALDGLRRAAAGVIERLGNTSTHDTERRDKNGDLMMPGHWRDATIRACAETVLGSPLVHSLRSDYRSLIGRAICRDLLAIAQTHTVFQSDATASPDMWSRIWRGLWRGHMDCRPERAASVEWVLGAIAGKGAKDEAASIYVAACNAVSWSRGNPGRRCGIITHRAWAEQVVAKIRAMHVSARLLSDTSKRHGSASVLVGWYGKHDRGTNSYHVAGIDALFIVGAFRPPMHAHHQVAAALVALGAEIGAETGRNEAYRLSPPNASGQFIAQAANRGTASESRQTAWVADQHRAAALTQAIERVRSVDRAAKGMQPALVRLIGVDATPLHISIPITYIGR